MEKVLSKLLEQHQLILNLLKEPDKVLELIQYVEEVHHPLEELELFPLIAQQPWLKQGGPRCSFHMGMRLERDPMERMKLHLAAFYKKAEWTPPAYKMPEWVKPENPISIPMEEHAVSHDLAESIKYLLTKKDSDIYKEYFKVLYNDFSDLLRLHIDKEDNCLFVNVRNHLG